VAHNLEAHAFRGGRARGNAGAIVADGQGDAATASVAETDGDGGGGAVLDGVANSFLDDAVEMGGGGLTPEEDGAGAVEPAGNAKDAAGEAREILEGFHEAAGSRIDGVKAMGKGAGVLG
jgi:hypothetical protein